MEEIIQLTYSGSLVPTVTKYVVIPVLLLVLACKLWTYYVTSCRDVTCSLPLAPGNFGIPFIGETIQIVLNMGSFHLNKRKQYGDIYVSHLLGRPCVRVSGCEYAKTILRGEGTLVESRLPSSVSMLLGKGTVSTSSEDKHLSLKKTLVRAFSFDFYERHVTIVQETMQECISSWVDDGQFFAYPEFVQLYFRLGCRLLVGIKLKKEECTHLLKIFEQVLSNMFSLPINLPGFGFRKAMLARDMLLQRIEDALKEREANPDQEAVDIFSILMATGGQDRSTKSEIKNMCLELMLAGHLTTSSAATYAVYALAKHPDVRQKIVEELRSHGLLYNSIHGRASDVNINSLGKLAYLHNFVREVLRRSPPVGGIFRKALKTFELGVSLDFYSPEHKVLRGYQVPKGWDIFVSVRALHSTDAYFADMSTFNPDRWQDGQDKEASFKFLPFGGGRRICPGKELAKIMLKIFTLEMVRNCEWSLTNDTTKFNFIPSPYPADNLPLTIKRADFDSEH